MEIQDIIKEEYGISQFPKKVSEAMAYVPFQTNNATTFTPAQGFVTGTMFPSLNKPFYGNQCGDKND